MGTLGNPKSQNLFAYVENNPLIYIDPTGHTSQGSVVATLIDIAKKKGPNSQSFWNIRARLGLQAWEFFPDAKETNNSQFRYLFDMATSSESNSDQAYWARQQLVDAFQLQNDLEQAAFDEYISGLLISLDLNIGKVGRVSTARKLSTVELGMLGEVKLGEIVLGGEANKSMRTSQGTRYIDIFDDGVAYESKVGYVKYSQSSLAYKQMLKDAELLKTKEVDRVVWYFFRNPNTGEIGADQRFLDELTQKGIEYILYD